MELGVFEESAWRAAGRPLPSAVARSVESLRAQYLGASEAAARSGPRRGAGLLARLAFFGIADAPKVGVVLGELAAADALPRAPRWRVLDLGAGPGTTSLALAEWLRQSGRRVSLELTLVDHDASSAAAARGLFAAWREVCAAERAPAPNVTLHTLTRDLRGGALPAGPFDLALCVNVLNELRGDGTTGGGGGDVLDDDDGGRGPEATDHLPPRLSLVRAALTGAIAADGSVCVIEPALREPSRVLHRLRDALAAEATVFAPCLRRGPCPMLARERDWCHEERPLALPERTRLVARLAGVRREALKFSYLTLRRDGRRLGDAFPGAAWRVVSAPLPSKGRDEIFVCGEPGRLRVLRNRRDRSEANESFDALHRGRLAAIEPLDPARPRVGAETRVHAFDPHAVEDAP